MIKHRFDELHSSSISCTQADNCNDLLYGGLIRLLIVRYLDYYLIICNSFDFDVYQFGINQYSMYALYGPSDVLSLYEAMHHNYAVSESRENADVVPFANGNV
jgi:hypothetical protein